MPGFNQTGPMGQGPMTGRGLGRCVDASSQANAKAPTPDSNEQHTTTFKNRGERMSFARGRRCYGMGRQTRFGGRR